MALVPLQAAILGAAVVNVPAGANLQNALNSAQPGDTVILQAGATWVGNYTLPTNGSGQFITIQSSAMGSLPGAGSRVSASQAGQMPKLVTPNGASALSMTTGANYYRIQGIEFASAAGTYVQDLISVGTAGETSVGALPHDIDLDRDYIHGDPTQGGKRGVALNGVNVTVENCWISSFFSPWQDTQAIAGWNGAGPFKIINNYLEAGTETVAFGGAVPAIGGVVPSDILIQNNLFSRPTSWRPGDPSFDGIQRWVKNHLELKSAQRVTIDNNTFENNWLGGDQRGFTLVFTIRTELNQVPWAVVQSINVTNNHIRNSAAGVTFTGHDDDGTGYASDFTLRNNVFDNINSSWGGDGRLFQMLGAHTVTIDHNTFFQNGYLLAFDNGPSTNINFTNNIGNVGNGIVGNGAGVGASAWNGYVQGGTFLSNAIIGANSSQYPAGNFYPALLSLVGFVNAAIGDYNLLPLSPLRGAGTDGKDIGSSFPDGNSTATPAPSAPSGSVPSSWVYLVSQNSGKCADVEGISTQPFANIHQWDCLGADNQKFLFTPVNGGYEVTVKNSGLQMNIFGGVGATGDGANLIQYPFSGDSNEVFQLVPMGDGTYEITANNSGKCLDVSNISTANGAQIHQWTCYGIPNQKWSLVPAQ